jgi:hypothetical protein
LTGAGAGEGAAAAGAGAAAPPAGGVGWASAGALNAAAKTKYETNFIVVVP